MQAWSGSSPTLSDLGDPLATSDKLPFLDGINAVMRVDRNVAATVADNHHVSVATEDVAKQHFSIGCSQNGSTRSRRDVNPVMKTAIARAKP
jgi:hypothetical protein